MADQHPADDRALFDEKIHRLDDKIDQTERYLTERCERLAAQIIATEKLLSNAQESAKEAVKIANDASKIRFESFNEFNARITQMTATFFTIPAFEQFRNAFEGFRTDVNKRLDSREGETRGVRLTGGMIMGAAAFLATILGIVALLIRWTARRG